MLNVVDIDLPGAPPDATPSVPACDTSDTRVQRLQGTLRNLLFTQALSRAPSRQTSPASEPIGSSDGAGFGQQQGHASLLQHLKAGEDEVCLAAKIRYLSNWGIQVAPWLDMFDQQRAFGIQVPILAQTCPSVLYAMLAVSARQMERRDSSGTVSHDSLELYSEAIAYLSPILDPREMAVLVTACILCVLEMMSVRPSDWRRHLEGCAALFEASTTHGFCGGLAQAVFWCYARMDLCGAIIADGSGSTVLPIEQWIVVSPPSDSRVLDGPQRQHYIAGMFLDKGKQAPDMYANYAVYLCACAYDLLANRTLHLEVSEQNGYDEDAFEGRWHQLWNALQDWDHCRPEEMKPVAEVTTGTNGSPFPRLLFAHWAAISGTQLFHTACIAMLEMRLSGLTLRDTTMRTRLWHARQIVGISLSNHHPGCLNNALQPLWVAGKLFSHHEEQKIVVELIYDIEGRTGWGTRWRIQDLETAWGYPYGTMTQTGEGNSCPNI